MTRQGWLLDLGSYPRLASSILAAATILITGCASTETAPRFSFAATPYGLLRLDGKTGETTAMHNGTWVPIAETPATLDQILRDGSRRH